MKGVETRRSVGSFLNFSSSRGFGRDGKTSIRKITIGKC